MIKAVPMTERSWILYENSNRCGLMRLTDAEEYAIMGGPYAGKYDSLDKLSAVAKIKFEKMKANKEQEKAEVGEYPVKHDTVFDLEPVDGLCLYTKIESSKDIYVAGYFSIKKVEKWQTTFCPRYKILSETEFHGPYKSKMDADHETRIENKKEENKNGND